MYYMPDGVSVPFTSGSSLQLDAQTALYDYAAVSVPFTSGSSLQLLGILFDCP